MLNKSLQSHYVSFGSISIVSHLHLGLPSDLAPTGLKLCNGWQITVLMPLKYFLGYLSLNSTEQHPNPGRIYVDLVDTCEGCERQQILPVSI
jgi:hypothetical protein